ncbi:CLUMA_CG013447, isoform A [Clunio marinus]|uniref:CLUMA_CG013447, isoform A n=1 Tax=Clunio marinus TaxID=568069 RepID=A0A1J1IKU7_9DIPT|nr:CLUMA_CG013447, isoform A [Clunio marinus]
MKPFEVNPQRNQSAFIFEAISLQAQHDENYHKILIDTNHKTTHDGKLRTEKTKSKHVLTTRRTCYQCELREKRNFLFHKKWSRVAALLRRMFFDGTCVVT